MVVLTKLCLFTVYKSYLILIRYGKELRYM